MSAITEMRSELGIDELLELVQALADRLDQVQKTQPFYTINEVVARLHIRRVEVERMLEDGRLWQLEGLDTSKTLIPAAALESLQQRPERLRAVG